MDHNAGLLAILKHAPVIPVLTVHGPDDAVPLAQALRSEEHTSELQSH